jgi:pyruvate formate lyase activating enzyme
VLNPDKLPTTSEQDILDYLQKNKKWLDGVCITGGEPTLHTDLPEFIEKLKQLGFLIKLDTNGTNPEMLRELIDKKLVDYIAMDIKSSPEKYEQAAQAKVNMDAIKKSVEMIRASNVEYEFRATVVPKFFDAIDAKAVGEWLKGSKKFCLQQFRPEKTLDKNFAKEKKYTHEQLHELADIMQQYFEVVEIRGI